MGVPRRIDIGGVLTQLQQQGGSSWAIAVALEIAFQADRCRNGWSPANDHQRARWFLGLSRWYGLHDGIADRSFAETRLRELRARFEKWRLAEWVAACERPGVVWESDPGALVACYRETDAVVHIQLDDTLTVALRVGGGPAITIWSTSDLRAALDALPVAEPAHPRAPTTR